MYPILFKYKFLEIGSYGVMLGLAFYCGFLLLEREFKRNDKDPELAYKILLTSIICGIFGAKLFHILDNFSDFLVNPRAMIFSGSGLSVYGGLVLALIACYFLVKANKEDYLELADMTAPILAVGYFLGRIGCHVSGDGCYGITTDSIFATTYPNGLSPISSGVFPTPLFESFLSFIFAGLMLNLRKVKLPKGTVFFAYLALNGITRFFIEFIRTNPKIAAGLTQAQFVGIGLFIFSASGIIYNRYKQQKV
jgi:phosphatidylglycerol:prolipoprotein diacylglycerol transferase